MQDFLISPLESKRDTAGEAERGTAEEHRDGVLITSNHHVVLREKFVQALGRKKPLVMFCGLKDPAVSQKAELTRQEIRHRGA